MGCVHFRVVLVRGVGAACGSELWDGDDRNAGVGTFLVLHRRLLGGHAYQSVHVAPAPKGKMPDKLMPSLRHRVRTTVFYIDMITIPPYELIVTEARADPQMYSIVRLLRVPFHIFHIMRTNLVYAKAKYGAKLGKALSLVDAHSRMLMFFGWLVWYLHVNACMTFLIVSLSRYTRDSWTPELWVLEQPLWTQYSWSLLMAVANSWPFTISVRPAIEDSSSIPSRDGSIRAYLQRDARSSERVSGEQVCGREDRGMRAGLPQAKVPGQVL
ncbi:hypothetical protein DFJ77DRAFT_113022 [Powellomyces hirtus]|nr:hypothetical protein DFJ77DRAFT_113022 [Powellomyces hirtus]